MKACYFHLVRFGEALRLASHKLPIRCKFVKREELDTVKEGDAE